MKPRTPSAGSKSGADMANLRDEIDGSALYRAMSALESDPKIAAVYEKLAAIEDRHADFWRKRLERQGIALRLRGPSPRTRMLIWISRRLGPATIAPLVARLESADSAKYDSQPDAVAAGMAQDERSHARIMNAIVEKGDGLSGPSIARLEGRHKASGGNALRAAVLGANDGLLSNLSLVMGVAGAATDNRMILITGMAGLIAGACSMALGEWLSVTSSRELYSKQISTERNELEANPAEEAEELALIYEAKGLPADDARRLAERLMSEQATALDTLAREELGIDPNELGGSALVAGSTSFGLFAAGALFPILPFFFVSGTPAIVLAVVSSALALGAVGVMTSIFTGRGVVFSALRQMAIGGAAAAVTYATGVLLALAIP